MTSVTLAAEDLGAILGMVAERHGLDFRDYRVETLERALCSRFESTSSATVEAYRARLARDPAEMGRLVSALVVPFTGFFRDPPVFEALARTVVPELARSAARRGLLRAWSAGTATGEEAWSLAMLMADACESGSAFEIVASDIDAGSVVAAAAGRYPLASVASVPAPLRERFFVVEGDEAVVAEPLRRQVHFSQHDLMGHALAPAEAIVASFDLVSLRNVLIYFDRRLQQKALERVASVLEPAGALVLGMVESLPPVMEAGFQPYPGVAPRLRIFRRKEAR